MVRALFQNSEAFYGTQRSGIGQKDYKFTTKMAHKVQGTSLEEKSLKGLLNPNPETPKQAYEVESPLHHSASSDDCRSLGVIYKRACQGESQISEPFSQESHSTGAAAALPECRACIFVPSCCGPTDYMVEFGFRHAGRQCVLLQLADKVR